MKLIKMNVNQLHAASKHLNLNRQLIKMHEYY